MINVWCVNVGNKYPDSDVEILRRQVRRHLSVEHKFRCLTDHHIDKIDYQLTPVNWPGWWQKLALFLIETGPALYLDLDVVVTGDLRPLISTDKLSMPKNWAQSGHGGCQSSVMSWNRDYRKIPWAFDPANLTSPEQGNYGWYKINGKKLWGDQEFITEMMGDPGAGNVDPMFGIKSYKYHCRSGLPEDTSVVCFHGDPKPHEVNEPWVKQARSFT